MTAALSPASAVLRGPRRGAVWVPDWPIISASLSGHTSLGQEAAILTGHRVVAASAPARRQGVIPGMTRRQALALRPDLICVPRDEEREIRTFEPILAALDAHIADISVTRPGLALFAASSPARHAGGEAALAEDIIGTVAEETGAEAHIGYCQGTLGAILAARADATISDAETEDFLHSHQLTVLRLCITSEKQRSVLDDFLCSLQRLGMTTLGDLAALDSSLLLSRFGTLALHCWHLAWGAEGTGRSSARTEGTLTVVREIDPPAENSDQAAFRAKEMAHDLATALADRGELCGRLVVMARTTDGSSLSRTWSLDGASEERDLTDRIRWQLQSWLEGRTGSRPAAPLSHLELVAEDLTSVGHNETPLWGGKRRGHDRATRAVLRVQGIMGEDGVRVPHLYGGRTPAEACGEEPWAADPPQPDPDAPWVGAIPRPWPAVVFPDPIDISIRCHCGAGLGVSGLGLFRCVNGESCSLTPTSVPGRVLFPHGPSSRPQGEIGSAERRRHSALAHARCTYGSSVEVVSWAGPWPLETAWWDARRHYRRAYVQLTPARGPALLVRVEQGQWKLEGIYS